jgi:hypothetical protein
MQTPLRNGSVSKTATRLPADDCVLIDTRAAVDERQDVVDLLE